MIDQTSLFGEADTPAPVKLIEPEETEVEVLDVAPPEEDDGALMLGGVDLWETPKPPYRVPSLAEVREVQGTSGLTLASTFSGCGGSSLGFRMAGYRVLYASEFIPAARETYLANFPETTVDPRDIREVKPEEIFAAAGTDEIDVLEGSPPCASFSMAGRREEHWGKEKKYSDTTQRVDDLFFEFTRILRGVRPRAFVAENVTGLLLGSAVEVFDKLFNDLRSCGYVVDVRVLNAWHFGVPQARRRVIFVGFRKDLGLRPVFPTALPYRYTLGDALLGGDPLPAPAEVDHEDEVGTALRSMDERYAIGTEWDKLRVGGQSERYFSLVRSDPNAPCQTVTQMGARAGAACVTHPHERRKFTIPELRRLCGFPDDFKLTGDYEQRWERLGRAVPPLMMRAVAASVRDALLALPGKTCAAS